MAGNSGGELCVARLRGIADDTLACVGKFRVVSAGGGVGAIAAATIVPVDTGTTLTSGLSTVMKVGLG